VFGAECGEALLLLLAEMVERERGFRAALAGILGEALRQRLQAGVGAFSEQVQSLAETVDALGLLLRCASELVAEMAAKAVETLLQFLATGALLLAQGAFDAGAVVLQRVQLRVQAGITAAAQQHGELQQQHQQGENDEDNQQGFVERHGTFSVVDASSVRRAVSPAASGFHVAAARAVHHGPTRWPGRASWNMFTIT